MSSTVIHNGSDSEDTEFGFSIKCNRYDRGPVVREDDCRDTRTALFYLLKQRIRFKRVSYWHIRFPDYRSSFFPKSGKIVMETTSRVLPERGLEALKAVLAAHKHGRASNENHRG